jgi:hypothetical protein
MHIATIFAHQKTSITPRPTAEQGSSPITTSCTCLGTGSTNTGIARAVLALGRSPRDLTVLQIEKLRFGVFEPGITHLVGTLPGDNLTIDIYHIILN